MRSTPPRSRPSSSRPARPSSPRPRWRASPPRPGTCSSSPSRAGRSWATRTPRSSGPRPRPTRAPARPCTCTRHLHAMGVAAAHRGREAGGALLRAVREAAAARGLAGVSLEVYAFNAAARAFYERAGFVPPRRAPRSSIDRTGCGTRAVRRSRAARLPTRGQRADRIGPGSEQATGRSSLAAVLPARRPGRAPLGCRRPPAHHASAGTCLSTTSSAPTAPWCAFAQRASASSTGRSVRPKGVRA